MNKGQSTLEFTMAFVTTILFVTLTVNLFIWFNHCMVKRQVAYEDTRSIAGGSGTEEEVGKADFFTPDNPDEKYKLPKLNVFAPGGYVEE